MKKNFLGLAFLVACMASSLSQASIVVNGNLSDVNDVNFHSFRLNSDSQIKIETFQWAGGTLSDGTTVVSADGFASQLNLFDVSGTWLTADFGGGSGRERTPGGFDEFDAVIENTFTAGIYHVAISYFDNLAGSSMSDPFEGSFEIDFAAGEGSNFTYEITGDVSAVPVPAAIWFMASGLVGLIGLQKRRTVVA
ncbi:MAG: DVUA0089 family protein [Methylococcaceae bacterium]